MPRHFAMRLSLAGGPEPAPSHPDQPALFGVDFRGSREAGGRNRKLWVASWVPGQTVKLEWGGDRVGFTRRELAARIAGTSGIWVLDFPFGPAAEIAKAMGWRHWEDYLRWCGGVESATTLRDQARRDVMAQGLRWSTRRRVDHQVETTWFPFFEQLYRRTILGAREVLAPLEHCPRDQVRILPWHEPFEPGDEAGSTVIEGFPGRALRNLGFLSSGYKGRGERCREKRLKIVGRLLDDGLPITDLDAERAVEDAEGDAMDALVLLVSARNASRRNPRDWSGSKADLEEAGYGMEGWFFD